MTYQLVSSEHLPETISPYFVEGAVLAANFTTKPLEPLTWLIPLFQEVSAELESVIRMQVNEQYHWLKRNEYSLLAVIEKEGKDENLADLAEGFMSVWPLIESNWQDVPVSDGTSRMLQALLTTFMLAIDSEQTHQQMQAAGIDDLPTLDDFLPQLDLMINEVALAADEALAGAKAQSVNPFKGTGRNDICPCGSGNKFKQCCGR
ncbi:YecA family protein [Vibrio sonorensis]|uniref:YecA family protein n=1 Tax=Vibrio sonorensis TaxID=1004316 RepID=UPI0008DAB196|nr:SEC-C metal-binding domain-containing protein [Vibrio sonorensis]